MAFSDEDIHEHLRTLRCPTGRRVHIDTDRSSGTFAYGALDTYGKRDETGMGVEPHMAKFKREKNAEFTLAEVGDRSKNHTGKLRWMK